MALVVLTDFDGTIVSEDTGVLILERFADQEWKIIEEQYSKGEITLEECLARQFSLVRVPESLILTELDSTVHFRPNFQDLIDYCQDQRAPLIIVSGGVDFCIRHLLGRKGWLTSAQIHAARATCTSEGIRFIFPSVRNKDSVNFKDDMVKLYKESGNQVAYLGDGLSDYPALKIADFAFVVTGSLVEMKCKQEGILHRPFSEFKEVVDAMRDESM